MSMLDLKDLFKSKKSRNNVRKVVYDKVLDKCHKHIKFQSNSLRREFCYYRIPILIMGYPSFPPQEVGEYIVECLLKNGLYSELVYDQAIWYVYISWRPEDIDIDGYNITKDNNEKRKYDIGAPVVKMNKPQGAVIAPTTSDSNVGMLKFSDNILNDMIPINMKKHYQAMKRRIREQHNMKTLTQSRK